MSISKGIKNYLHTILSDEVYEKLVIFKHTFKINKNVFLVAINYYECIKHLKMENHTPFTLFASCLVLSLKTCEDDKWMNSYIAEALDIDLRTLYTIEKTILTNMNYNLINIEGVQRTRTQLRRLSISTI
eukprot:NODE_150_length_17275_cov_0.559618.p14 type:complete len:130 gc:universal NODE_150_length_17275_cov_0.559618:16759-17148(+)